jgi:hypothetical protein
MAPGGVPRSVEHLIKRRDRVRQGLNRADLIRARRAPLVVHDGQLRPEPEGAPDARGSGTGSSARPPVAR